uniref:Uncharacterized protein n=1 Tax=Candidatus Kentrum sp. LFY TaxID=2126342 RepID=A0A450W6B3_9GAMM|nr:MAG: hypothetical protein BECKLFY1418C_GA0070996_100118 [Candidatus Kentron sp. LFY]
MLYRFEHKLRQELTLAFIFWVLCPADFDSDRQNGAAFRGASKYASKVIAVVEFP